LRHFSEVKGIKDYVQQLVLGLVRVWDEVGARKKDEVMTMQKGQRPIKHLKYCEYVAEEYAMICIVPKSRLLGWIDTQYRQINLKLQPRYAGPYRIIRRVSPVVYVLEVDGAEKTVHAVNMKPYQGRKDALTPFVEPGYERMEAGQLRKPEKPLLLSPDEELNQKATTQYKKKKLTAKQQTTKAVNANRQRIQREEATKHRLSNSQSEDVWILVDAEQQDPDEDEEDDEDSETFLNTEFRDSVSLEGATEQEETELVSGEGQEKVATNVSILVNTTPSPQLDDQRSQTNLKQQKTSDHCEIRLQNRELILEAALIDGSNLDPDDSERIDQWIDKISCDLEAELDGMTATAKRTRQLMATDQEYIGWQLRDYDRHWKNTNSRATKLSNLLRSEPC
jgi:hypothetical protein